MMTNIHQRKVWEGKIMHTVQCKFEKGKIASLRKKNCKFEKRGKIMHSVQCTHTLVVGWMPEWIGSSRNSTPRVIDCWISNARHHHHCHHHCHRHCCHQPHALCNQHHHHQAWNVNWETGHMMVQLGSGENVIFQVGHDLTFIVRILMIIMVILVIIVVIPMMILVIIKKSRIK